MARRPRRRLPALVVLALVWAVLPLLGSGEAAAAAEEPGRLRIAHLSPDTPAVDVAVTPAPPDGPAAAPGDDVATALAYGEVGGYRDLAPGSYAVGVRPAGSPATTPPALSVRVEVPAGGARTLALTGGFADLALTTLPDELTAPPAGTARVRVLAAASGAPTLDVAVEGGPALVAGLPFPGAGGYVPVPAGPATLRLSGGAGSTTVPADLTAGTVVTVLVLDAPDGGLAARTVVDAAAPTVVPAGAVEAGGAGDWFGAVVAAVVPRLPGPAVDGEVPTHVRVPAAGIDAVLTGAGLDPAGALAVPGDPAVAGWYTGGPLPGRPGPAVLAGHVDWAGRPAVFAGLDRLVPGDAVEIGRADGSTLRFTVTEVRRVAKDAFPTAAVYGPVPGAELRLITCGGAFDRAAGSYTGNVVVLARPA